MLSATVADVTLVPPFPPSGSTIGQGQTLTLEVDFTAGVHVTGTPTIQLNDTVGSKVATYVSGSGSNSLLFTFTVPSGDTTSGNPLDYVSTTALNLNGGTINDVADEGSADLTLPATDSLSDELHTADLIVNDAAAPTVVNVSTTTASGTYATGRTITIDLNLSKAVTVTSGSTAPTLELSDGATATYTGASSGTITQLVFIYTVGAGETTNTQPLDYTADGLNLGNYTFTDDNSNALGTTLPTPGTNMPGDSLNAANIVIDTSTPAVSSVSTPNTAGTYGAGAVISVDVNFSEKVFVTGTPTLALSDGHTATYSSGSGSQTLVFTYTVPAGDSTNGAALDYTSTAALVLPTGSDIANAADTDAATTLPSPGSANDGLVAAHIVISSVQPTPPTPYQAALAVFTDGFDLILDLYGFGPYLHLPAPSQLIANIQSNLPYFDIYNPATVAAFFSADLALLSDFGL